MLKRRDRPGSNDRMARNAMDSIRCARSCRVCSPSRVNTALHANEMTRIACARCIVSVRTTTSCFGFTAASFYFPSESCETNLLPYDQDYSQHLFGNVWAQNIDEFSTKATVKFIKWFCTEDCNFHAPLDDFEDWNWNSASISLKAKPPNVFLVLCLCDVVGTPDKCVPEVLATKTWISCRLLYQQTRNYETS